jgi:hypothetical protein
MKLKFFYRTKRKTNKHILFILNKLYCAIQILVTPVLCAAKNEEGYYLLIDFVTHYGAHFITHNIYSLINLPFYVKVHICLDNFSAFKYENYLGIIK